VDIGVERLSDSKAAFSHSNLVHPGFDDCSFYPQRPLLNLVRQQSPIIVVKIGVGTGLTHGILVSLDSKIVNNDITYRHQVIIRWGKTVFSHPGDSGAIYYAWNPCSEDAPYIPIAIHRGSFHITAEQSYSYGTSFKLGLEALCAAGLTSSGQLDGQLQMCPHVRCDTTIIHPSIKNLIARGDHDQDFAVILGEDQDFKVITFLCISGLLHYSYILW